MRSDKVYNNLRETHHQMVIPDLKLVRNLKNEQVKSDIYYKSIKERYFLKAKILLRKARKNVYKILLVETAVLCLIVGLHISSIYSELASLKAINKKYQKDLRVVTAATLDLIKNKRKSNAYFLSSTNTNLHNKLNGEVIVKVNVDKLNIRTGAGKNHSPLMTVAKNTRLAVEAEEANWFRVTAPSGERGYVYKDLVEVLNEV